MVATKTEFVDFTPLAPVDATNPFVASANALTAATIEVNFNEKMIDNAALRDMANYVLDDPALTVTNVLPFGDSKVRLFVNEMQQDKTYVVVVGSALQTRPSDLAGNPLDAVANVAQFSGVGDVPSIDNVLVIDERRIRVFFSEPMLKDAALLSPFSYTVLALAAGAPINVGSVVAPNDDNPTFVDLLITEMTNAESYQAMISNVADVAGNVVSSSTFNFTGVGVPPVLLRIEAISKSRVDLVFDEDVASNVFAQDPANYIWDNGLTTVSVSAVEGKRIKLVTSDQTPGILYTVTIG